MRAALLAAAVAVALPAPASAADWTTFGFDRARTGFNPAERALSPRTAGSLRQAWDYDLGGVVNAQPLYAEDVGRRDVVFAASEAGQVAALDSATGTPIWTREVTAVDTICNDVPEGIHGVSATPVLDRRRRTIWVAGGDGRVWAFDLATGRTRKGWPVRVGRKAEHVWGALALRGSRLYVATASHCNNAFYRGRVVALHPDTGSRRAQWQALGQRAYGGGVWGWGGAAIGAGVGDVFVATANAQGDVAGHIQYAEHVVRLSARLRFEQANDPGPPRHDDNDFTGAPILFDAPGCPRQLAVMHKTGQLFLYDRATIRRGPRQRIQAGSLDAFVGLGTYAWAPARRTLYLANGSSGTYPQGLVALRLDDRCRLRRAWEQPFGEEPTWPTAPVVANGVVVVGDGSQKTLRAFNARTGALLWESGGLAGDLYGAPIIAGGRVYAPSWDNKLHAFAAG